MRTWLFVLLGAFWLTACPEDEVEPGEVAPEVEVQPGDLGDTPKEGDDAEGEPGVACCPTGACRGHDLSCVDGACLPELAEEGACYGDLDCDGGMRCLGATKCACGEAGCVPKVGVCGFGEGCCEGDEACDGGHCVLGACKDKPEEGCLIDAHCEVGQVCEGQQLVACGAEGVEEAGYCALKGICCLSDRECGEGRCLEGRCLGPVAEGACWEAGDCDEGTCLGAAICPCGEACEGGSYAGICGALEAGVCEGDGACAAGERCVEGRCLEQPDVARNQCWVDGHCGLGRVCEGAERCEAGGEGCEPAFGLCRTLAMKCGEGGACPVGMRCIQPDVLVCPGGPEPEGYCVEELDEGCWQSSDCGSDALRCAAEVVCVEEEGCEWPNRPGECAEKLPRWACCDAHTECGPGTSCRNQDTTLGCAPNTTAICLPDPVAGESCWNRDDCAQGEVCGRVWVCGCDGKCAWNRAGNCERPLHCLSDQDCSEGMKCAVDPECFASPCTSAGLCQSGGTCQLEVDGGCWSHEECGDGQYCEGLKVCQVHLSCPEPDQPGQCAPRAGLGECCTSFRGCASGLRCLSPMAHSGCGIDHSSVCVPALVQGVACYGDEDCDAGQRCEGAQICPCGSERCEGEPEAGRCMAR